MNATEIMLKAPTIIKQSVVVTASPTNSAMNTAAIMRPERNASHRITSCHGSA
jgi:hypothetical protein